MISFLFSTLSLYFYFFKDVVTSFHTTWTQNTDRNRNIFTLRDSEAPGLIPLKLNALHRPANNHINTFSL